MRLLRIASAAELLSLAVLLTNLFTVHAKVITTFGGPLHGISYVTVIAAASLAPSTGLRGTMWRAFVPGVGGLLALRHLRAQRAERTGHGSV
ncbi:hypothetical protein ACFWY5_37130 [Nonomuraea sp. NPDC059007]|uniref:hypothetical protein n=1 Tax=Nonomuraea sp. NPDC059007 TaxID=3346692 RepID=UPI0036842F88